MRKSMYGKRLRPFAATFHCEARPNAAVLARRLGWDIHLTEEGEFEISIGGISMVRHADHDFIVDYLGFNLTNRAATGTRTHAELADITA